MKMMTTIRVDQTVRDRLASLAEAHGRSLGAELAAILDDLQWQAIEAGYRRLAAQPEGLAAYRAEAEAFSSIDLNELADTAGEEYPEYNGGTV
jgi:predicted transcriptional regulator